MLCSSKVSSKDACRPAVPESSLQRAFFLSLQCHLCPTVREATIAWAINICSSLWRLLQSESHTRCGQGEFTPIFFLVCCHPSCPVEVIWDDNLCFNLATEKKPKTKQSKWSSRCLLPGNKHFINNFHSLKSSSCWEVCRTCKEFKVLTRFLLLYCLQASSFILNNCYYLCLEVVSVVPFCLKLGIMKNPGCPNRFKCVGRKFEGTPSMWEAKSCSDGWSVTVTSESRAARPETLPAAPRAERHWSRSRNLRSPC